MIPLKLDFGGGDPVAGYTGIDVSNVFDPERLVGWISNSGLQVRDRNVPDRILGRFIFGKSPATLRVALEPGRYDLRFIMGDAIYRDHILQITLSESDHAFPLLTSESGEYAALETTTDVSNDFLDITFSSPTSNWVINSLTLVRTTGRGFHEPVVSRGSFEQGLPDCAVVRQPDPQRVVEAADPLPEISEPPPATTVPDGALISAFETSGAVGRVPEPHAGSAGDETQGLGTANPVTSAVAASRVSADQRKVDGVITKTIRTLGTWLGI